MDMKLKSLASCDTFQCLKQWLKQSFNFLFLLKVTKSARRDGRVISVKCWLKIHIHLSEGRTY